MKWLGYCVACYLATALLSFFASVIIAGPEGGHVAIDVFFFYLSDSWRWNLAEAILSALRG